MNVSSKIIAYGIFVLPCVSCLDSVEVICMC